MVGSQHRPIRGLAGLVFLVQFFVLVLHVAGGLIALNVSIDQTVALYTVAFVFGVHGVWAVWSWAKLTGRWFNPYILFITSVVLFNGGHLLLLLFGRSPSEVLDGDFGLGVVAQSAFLVSFGTAALHAGGLGALAFKRRKRKESVFQSIRQRGIQLDGLRMVGLILLAISAVPAAYLLVGSLALAVKGGYMALYQRDFATGIGAAPRILANFLVPASFLLLASYRGRKHMVYLSALLILVHSFTYLFIGYRGLSLFPLVAYAWLWHRTVRPIPKTVFTVAMPLVLLLLPVVKMIRGASGAERTSVEGLVGRASGVENPLAMTLTEMGNTMATVAHTLELVPSVRPFDWGASYLYAVTTALPNLFWDIHPAVARGTPSEWLIWEVNPWIAQRGGGLGYSLIAEAYLNFGWWGAPVVLLALGFAFGRFVLWAMESEHPARLAAVACFLPTFMFYARADTSLIMRPLMWYVIIPYLLVLLVGRSMRWRRRPRAQRASRVQRAPA